MIEDCYKILSVNKELKYCVLQLHDLKDLQVIWEKKHSREIDYFKIHQKNQFILNCL